MGVSLAGYEHLAVIEWDQWACETIRQNQERGFPLVKDWPLHQADVRSFDYSTIPEGIELVSGGPPCQPFSIGGKHRGYEDSRDMFPAAVGVVRKLRPLSFMFENVPGLARPSFANYFQYIQLQLSYPEIVKRSNETWHDHLSRLERYKTGGNQDGLWYRVVARKLNAANYGIPQKRERVFIVGFRCDVETEWSFPEPTHSFDDLVVAQWVTGEYWERHKVPKKKRPSPSGRMCERLRNLSSLPLIRSSKPWQTVRDAFAGLPEPEKKSDSTILNHKLQLGAKPYPGHTGSPLDEPAKTLKAGDHGVPGGENMVMLPNRKVRYFTVRESARLQTFPDEFIFHGSWSETMRQLGNAVPVMLAKVVSTSIAERLRSRANTQGSPQGSASRLKH